jgi:hypothetical protein
VLEQASSADEGSHVGRLNCASARRPGSIYRERVGFQEEASGRSNAVVNCRETKMEGLNGANIASKSHCTLDLWTLSPALVPFFRGQSGALLDQGPAGHRRLSLGLRERGAEERDETMR